MGIWLFRAGKNGEYEKKFLDHKKIYLTWDGLNTDLSMIEDKRELYETLNSFYPNEKMGRIRNWTGQIWPIAKDIKIGDWVILPSKLKSAIHIGVVKGEYQYDKKADDPYFHYREVEWIETDIPRTNFDQDILYSLGAFMTVCRIQRNDAEYRIKKMKENNWRSTLDKPKEKTKVIVGKENSADHDNYNLEDIAKDQIAKYIIRKFKGHGMAKIIEAILKAKGYVTYISPEGPDKGIDILAAPEPLGFGFPKIVVQVKSGDMPTDRLALDQLIGNMQTFNADQGLLVSWSGFKQSVDREIPSQFFRVRLWGQKEIIEELLENYHNLEDEIKVELPLTRVWTLSIADED